MYILTWKRDIYFLLFVAERIKICRLKALSPSGEFFCKEIFLCVPLGTLMYTNSFSAFLPLEQNDKRYISRERDNAWFGVEINQRQTQRCRFDSAAETVLLCCRDWMAVCWDLMAAVQRQMAAVQRRYAEYAETDTDMQRDRETEREEEWKFEISN